MRQCDSDDFKNVLPALTLAEIQKRLCPNLGPSNKLILKNGGNPLSFSLQIRNLNSDNSKL